MFMYIALGQSSVHYYVKLMFQGCPHLGFHSFVGEGVSL